jgi:Ca-activated chloride channel family protein
MSDSLKFEMQSDVELISSEVPSQRVLELVLIPPEERSAHARPALNLALVIDRSGSMSGDKLEYVKQAAAHVVDLLQERDQVAVVAYDTRVSLISPSVAANARNKATLKAHIAELVTGDMTNLSEGWLTGCQEVAGAAQEGMLNRVLLLTDGLANEGITDMEALGVHASQLLKRGVATSTFGVGEGYNEHLLEHMANQGGGRFYYIASPASIPNVFVQEFNELAAVTARGVEITLHIPANVDAQVLGSWKSEKANGELHIWLGDVASAQRREVYVKLLTPPASGGAPSTGGQAEIVFRAQACAKSIQGEALSTEAQVTLRYAPQSEVAKAPQRADLMERYSLVEMADRATEALKLEREGEREKASKLLEVSLQAAAPHIPQSAAAEYLGLSQRLREGLDEQTRKARHQAEYTRKQRRS